MSHVKRLPLNAHGRDFVCGDIHGCYEFVEKFLRSISFNKEIDRLICTGDLIDRGPDNELCLSYLYEPWFHMVKGNHEQLMEMYFKDDPIGMYWPLNGGQWGTQYKNDKSDLGFFIRDAVHNKIDTLPYLITCEKRSGGIFHVIHAEFYPLSKLTDEILASPEFIDHAFIQTTDGETIFWGRFIFLRWYNEVHDARFIKKRKVDSKLKKLDAIFNEQLSHIYSGHTCVQAPIQFYGQTNLDTMAFGRFKPYESKPWQGLTFTEPETGKFWLVNDVEFKEVNPLIINDD